MTAVWSFLVGLALVVGLFFHTMGVLGILRFPDVYTRLHADTKATTFGSIFIALAAVLVAAKLAWGGADGGAGTWVNLIVHIAFAVVVLLVTNATGGHAIARAAWRAGHRPAAAVVDRLGEPCEEEEEGEKAEAVEVAEAVEAEEATEVTEAPVAVEGEVAVEAVEAPEAMEGIEGMEALGAPEEEAGGTAAVPEGEATADLAGGEEGERATGTLPLPEEAAVPDGEAMVSGGEATTDMGEAVTDGGGAEMVEATTPREEAGDGERKEAEG